MKKFVVTLVLALVIFGLSAAAGASAAAAFVAEPVDLAGATLAAGNTALELGAGLSPAGMLPPAVSDLLAVAVAVLAGALTILGGVVAIASAIAPFTKTTADDLWAARGKALLDRISLLPVGFLRSGNTGLRPVKNEGGKK